MNRRKRRFVMLVVPLAVILIASLLAAQEPPNQCAEDCLRAYRNDVITCNGDVACLADARADLEACIIQGCGLLPPR